MISCDVGDGVGIYVLRILTLLLLMSFIEMQLNPWYPPSSDYSWRAMLRRREKILLVKNEPS